MGYRCSIQYHTMKLLLSKSSFLTTTFKSTCSPQMLNNSLKKKRRINWISLDDFRNFKKKQGHKLIQNIWIMPNLAIIYKVISLTHC